MAKTFHHRQGGKQILVAEDNSNDFKLLNHAYSRTGLPHRLQRVGDGLEVVSYLEGLPPFRDRRTFPLPDLLLLDLDMPGMYGFQVLEWLRNSPEWSKLPVVVLSCSNSDHDREKAYELGARAFYTKDASLDDTQEMLLTICRDWLGSLQPA
jgi:CheY-like chemotaxis protein